MALSETQLSGLKKSTAAITDEDLMRIFTALGLRKVTATEPGTVALAMRIVDGWQANALAFEVPSDTARKAYRVDLFVNAQPSGKRLGPVFRTDDVNVLQRKGAAIMAEMFASVDDLTVFGCPGCETGLLTWDNQKGTRTTKPGMTCTACDWHGNTGKFAPFRELR